MYLEDVSDRSLKIRSRSTRCVSATTSPWRPTFIVYLWPRHLIINLTHHHNEVMSGSCQRCYRPSRCFSQQFNIFQIRTHSSPVLRTAAALRGRKFQVFITVGKDSDAAICLRFPPSSQECPLRPVGPVGPVGPTFAYGKSPFRIGSFAPNYSMLNTNCAPLHPSSPSSDSSSGSSVPES
jgi:hypothetical protein